MINGSCLCGAFKFFISGELGPSFYCHCGRCKKASGTLFAVNSVIDEKQINVIDGKGSLSVFFNKDAGVARFFCKCCGSPIYSINYDKNICAVRVGVLDQDKINQPIAHIYSNTKNSWLKFSDELPCFDGLPFF